MQPLNEDGSEGDDKSEKKGRSLSYYLVWFKKMAKRRAFWIIVFCNLYWFGLVTSYNFLSSSAKLFSCVMITSWYFDLVPNTPRAFMWGFYVKILPTAVGAVFSDRKLVFLPRFD